MLTLAKRVLIGRPLASSEQDHQRLPKTFAALKVMRNSGGEFIFNTEEPESGKKF